MKYGPPPPLFNRIRQAAIPDAIKRLLGLTAEMGTPQLAPELQFSIDLYQAPEFWVLLGGVLCEATFNSQAAAPGFNGIVAVNNPAGSGEIAIVERVISTNNAGAARVLLLSVTKTLLTTPTTATWVSVDTRKVASGPTQLFPPTRVLAQSSAAGVADAGAHLIRQYNQATLAVQEVFNADEPCILAPGTSLQIFTSNVNEATPTISLRCRIRAAQGTELNLS